MYAIIDDGGRQHRVTAGQVLNLIREETEEKTITFERVLLVGGGDGEPTLGLPIIAGATVVADVIGTVKGKKIDIIKHRRRKGFHKKIGHRQTMVAVKIASINL